MIIKRVFDIIDSVGDGVISFDDFARGLFPLASSQAFVNNSGVRGYVLIVSGIHPKGKRH